MDELVWHSVAATTEADVNATRTVLREIATEHGLSPTGLVRVVAGVWEPAYDSTVKRLRKPDLKRIADAGEKWADGLTGSLLKEIADEPSARQLRDDKKAVLRIVERLREAERKKGRRPKRHEKALYEALKNFWLASGKEVSRTWTDTNESDFAQFLEVVAAELYGDSAVFTMRSLLTGAIK